MGLAAQEAGTECAGAGETPLFGPLLQAVPTLGALKHLAVQLRYLPVLVAATLRSNEVTREHPLWALLPELQRSGRWPAR